MPAPSDLMGVAPKRYWSAMRYAHRTVVPATLLLVTMLAGCAGNPPARKQASSSPPPEEIKHVPARPAIKPLMTVDEVEKAPLDGDIGLVHPSFTIFPWVQFDPSDPRPQGLSVSALYLISNKTEKGVFADGVITVKMFRIDRQPDGREMRTPVHAWSLNPQEAMPYRSHRRTVFGEGYGLQLQWPKDLDVLNKEVMVIVEFTRRDGKVISSMPKFLKVPTKMNG